MTAPRDWLHALRRKPDVKIIGGYWLLFAYCIGAARFVRALAPPLPAVVWCS